MKFVYAILACTFAISLTAFCIAAMIQMSHPWEAPPWMGLTVRGVCWSFCIAAAVAISQLVSRVVSSRIA